MLVLKRAVGQEIVIGDPAAPLLTVTVLKLDGNRVSLGFQAVERLRINRREVADRLLTQDAAPDA